MCQFDVSQYIYPCNTFIYYLTQRCRQSVSRCRKVNLRQRHVRKEGPCRYPQVCDWCNSVNGMNRDAVMKLWNEAKSMPKTLHRGISVLPTQRVPVPEVSFVEYDGTTYYVSPTEFQRRVLPDLLKKAETKNILNGKAMNYGGTSEPVIVVTPTWEPEPTTAICLGTTVTPIDQVDKAQTLVLSRHADAPRKNGGTVNDKGKNLGRNHFSQFRYPLGENRTPLFNRQQCCEWRFHEELDQQGRFVAAVNYPLNAQEVPERALFYPGFTYIDPQSFVYGEYYGTLYQMGKTLY